MRLGKPNNAQASHQPPPTLPHGFGDRHGNDRGARSFRVGFYDISLGQVALGRCGVLGATSDGVVGALKNVLPLLVFAISLTGALSALLYLPKRPRQLEKPGG